MRYRSFRINIYIYEMGNVQGAQQEPAFVRRIFYK